MEIMSCRRTSWAVMELNSKIEKPLAAAKR